MPIFHWNLDQGSAQWYSLRAAIPTASEFDKVLTPSKGDLSEQRHKYACRIIAARLLNWQPDSLDKIEHIAAGKENEPRAVARLELIHDITTRPVGFVTSDDGRFGCSPDRVANIRGNSVGITVEVKCPTIPVQFERLLFGHGAAYRCQVQGQLWIAQADKAIFQSYCLQTPDYMIETGRDEPFLRKLSDALERFSDELETLTEKAQSLGAYQAFERILPPQDASYAEELRGVIPEEW